MSKGVVPQVNFMHRRVDFHVKEETLLLRNSSGNELSYDKFITLTDGGILAVACTKENWSFGSKIKDGRLDICSQLIG